MEKTCYCCGKVFESKRGDYQKYCSEECRNRKYNELRRHNMAEKQCAVCGKMFKPSHPKQATCSQKCQRQRLNEYNKQYREDYLFIEHHGRTCVICGKHFVQKMSRQRVCSAECKKAIAVIRRKKMSLLGKRNTEPISCIVCRKEFIGKTSLQKTCSEKCREELRRAVNHAHYEKRKLHA